MLLVPPPFPPLFPAANLTPRRHLRLSTLSRRLVATPAAASNEVDALTQYSGYLFELSSTEAESLAEYKISKISAIYQKKPLILFRRMFQIAATLGRWFALRYYDGITDRADLMFEVVRAAELRKILVQLGPAYVKIAQAISSPPIIAAPPIKFGILGCAEIARKVSRAIILSPNSTLHAVGSRSHEKAAKFAKENGFPDTAKVYGSYDAVLDDPEVDAVYVPLPTSLHIKWAVLAAEKKKHLLLEKPVALNVGELDVILEACESNGVQFMDSTMWMHHPRTAKMKEFLLDSSLFGELKAVHSCFTFAAGKDFLENDIRVKPDLDALGVLGDVGWYCIRSILWAADFELPKTALALRGTVFNGAGVIIGCSASLQWEDGKTATFHCSFLANLTMDVTVVGTNGTLKMHDFVIPFEESKASFSTAVKSGFKELLTGWDPKPSEHTVTTELPHEALMVKEFSRLVGSIKSDSAKPDNKWPTLSRKTQLVLDAVKASIERGYETVQVIS